MDKKPDEAIILTRSDVRRLAGVADYHRAIVAVFRSHAAGEVSSPPPMEIAGEGGALHAKGAAMSVDGRRFAALKLNANFPANPDRFGLPTIQGAVLLFDAANGAPLAIMDSIEITLRRTAAASAVAMDALARGDAKHMLVCGCGAQAAAHLEATARLRPFESIYFFDQKPERAARLIADFADRLPSKLAPVADLKSAAQRADVIVTLTPSATPLLDAGDVKPGAFIAAVGADNPHKNEIAPALLQRAAVIADVADQSIAMGDMRAAIAAGAVDRRHIRAELGAVLVGSRPGRLADDEIIIFDSTGAAFQDVAAAAMIWRRARSADIARTVRLGE